MFDQDANIYEWFSENLHLVREPSMRLYLRASELKRAGMDWMDIVPLAPEYHRQRLVAELQADTSYGTEESRAQEFIARDGGVLQSFSQAEGEGREHADRSTGFGCGL